MKPSVSLGAILCALSFVLCGAKAHAAQVSLGLQAIVGGATHRETGINIATPVGAPLVLLRVRQGPIEIVTETLAWVPNVNLSPTQGGLESIHLSYFDSTLRYWVTNNVAVGIGDTLWNQRTSYVHGSPSSGTLETDYSRGAGTRYELVVQQNAGPNLWRLNLAANPRMHGRFVFTLQATGLPPGVTSPIFSSQPASEQAGEFDGSISWVHQLSKRAQLEAGVRYINISAAYDSGAFADANRVIGPFVSVLFRLH